MNHCILEVEVKQAPKLRYTQDNKTPISEMEVQFDGLRADDDPAELKVVGWGNLAEELQNRVQAGQKLLVEGRLRMNMVPRQDGTKEKRAELTLTKLHPLSNQTDTRGDTNKLQNGPNPTNTQVNSNKNLGAQNESSTNTENGSWNSAPLIPDTDEIPF